MCLGHRLRDLFDDFIAAVVAADGYQAKVETCQESYLRIYLLHGEWVEKPVT